MDSSREISPEEEEENAHVAVKEERQTGKTERRCLRDGGRLILEDFGSAYVIRCENGDFKMTVRGI
jgi:hypothetical protein